MKSSQWIGALIVLVVAVFVITFTMNFLGDTGKATTPTTRPGSDDADSQRRLTFFATKQPASETDFIYHEEHKAGWAPFLFENPYDEEIKVGLDSKSCQCLSVQIVLASPEWKARRALLIASELLATPGAELPFPLLPFARRPFFTTNELLMPHYDKTLFDLEQGLKPLAVMDLNGKIDDVVIPGKSLGWVRVDWPEGKTDAQNYTAGLWFGHPGNRPNQQLEARVRFAPAIRVSSSELVVNEVNERDLEKKPFTGSFTVFSSTRPSLRLKTQVIRPMRYDAKRFDPLEVGGPTQLSLEECEALKKTAPNIGKVLCAYRIPVALKGSSEDGKVKVDLGVFRRRLRVWSDDDEGAEPMELTVTGSVQGSVAVTTNQDLNRINLGVFDASTGSGPQTAVLTANKGGIQLEVDRDRTVEYLREGLRLEELSPLAGLPRWKLHVQVKPDAAHGFFPREDDPVYRDSAVYLKTKGDVIQNVRIPVQGAANER